MSSSFVGKVLDNYRILERLGIGGMGVVFRAIHIELDKVFAIKLIAPGLAMNEHFIKRFQTEAKALAKFEDPNIVRIYDLRSADDQWFIVMEYVPGTTLTDKILKDGAIHWLEAVPIMKQVINAISHAHKASIIHRDIKPNNIMLNDKGVVKITDFGLAKDQTKTPKTLTVASGGTLFYMSPEHVKGFSFIDARSDLYSIGMTFYEMLTGIVPFQNIKSDFDIRESIVRKEFDKPQSINPTIPSELETIVMRSIRKNPDDRYQTADDMMQAIVDFETKYGISEKTQTAKKERNAESPVVYNKSLKKIDGIIPPKTIEPTISVKKVQIFKRIGVVFVITLILLFIFKYKLFLHSSSQTEQIQEEKIFSNLTISSTPTSAWIILNGDSLGQTPLRNHKLQAGQYSLKMSKDSYHSIDTTIFLTMDNDLSMFVTLQKIETRQVTVQANQKLVPKQAIESAVFVKLSIQSDPSLSEIWLNGKLIGKTPFESTKITPGNYLLEIRKESYEKYTRNLNLAVGNIQRINAKLKAFSGGLSVIKDPPSATLLVDGKKMNSQNSPVSNISGFPIGKHYIEVVHPGYVSFKKDIEIKQNETFTINAQLVRREGYLSIQVRPWGSIYINNQLQKSTADVKYTVKLPVDQYDIKVEHPTLGSWQKAVHVNGDESTNVIVNFTQIIQIHIKAVDDQDNPLIGEIYVDGNKIGKDTPSDVSLRVGVHKIGVKKQGYYANDGEKDILLDSDIDKSLIFILKREN